jgi:hypothetical protein
MRILAQLSRVAFFLALGAFAVRTAAREAMAPKDSSARPSFSEPVALASNDGVLEVTPAVHRGIAHLDDGTRAWPLAGT